MYSSLEFICHLPDVGVYSRFATLLYTTDLTPQLHTAQGGCTYLRTRRTTDNLMLSKQTPVCQVSDSLVLPSPHRCKKNVN